MKALWILNSPIGTAASVLGYPGAASGTWIRATEEKLKEQMPQLQIDYAVLGYRDRTVVSEDGNCTVYEVAVPQCRGKRRPASDITKWKTVIDAEAPALIHIWGTEFTNGLDVLDACGDIPVAVTIQGVIASIAKYVRSDVPFKELMRGHALVALPAYIRAKQREQNMVNQVPFESEMIRRAQAVCVGNGWEKEYCRFCSKDVNFKHLPLCIDKAFLQKQWDVSQMEAGKIFTIAPSSAMKGAHQVIRALSVVVKQFPNVKLFIPGDLNPGKKALITEPPYFRYLRRLIKELGLEKYVEFCGKLSTEQMAAHMLTANVFVMPSKAENHSTTLREAMNLGCPCVSSIVGCVHEFAVHNENCLLYRYEEYEVLALEMIRVLSDKQFAAEIGEKGREAIKRAYPMEEFTEIVQWYSEKQ